MCPKIAGFFETLAPSATLAMNERAKDMVSSGIDDLLFFTVGEPDFNAPENVRNAMKKALDLGFTGYTPTTGIPELKKAIANKLEKENKIPAKASDIMVSTGAKQALYNVVRAITDPGDEFIIPRPYWVSYPEIVKLSGGVPVFAGDPGSVDISVKDIESVVTDRTKALILNSPSNPSGFVISKEVIQKIAELAEKRDFFIISDEIYEKLIFKGEHFSPASIPGLSKRVITINGVSKSHAMTGLRIGYAHGPSEVIKAAAKLQGHSTSNPNSVSQYGALEALNGPTDALLKMKKAFLERREYFYKRLKRIKGFEVVETAATFYVFPKVVLFGMDGDTMAEELLIKYHIASIPGSAFGAPDFIRFSCATAMEDIKEMCNRLEKAFGIK